MPSYRSYSPQARNWPILLVIGLLLCLSSLCIWSIEVEAAMKPEAFYRHLFAIFLALMVFFGICFYRYEKIQKWVVPLYVFSLVLLLLVLLIGPTISGSQRWIFLGPISFQPSELAKVVLILSLASHLGSIQKFQSLDFLALGMHLFLPLLLIYREPDLGTSLLIIAIFMAMLLVSPLSTFVLLVVGTPLISLFFYFYFPVLWLFYLGGACLFFLIWYLLQRRQSDKPPLTTLILYGSLLLFNVGIIWGLQWGWDHMKDYQKQRILTYISAEEDLLGSGYQVQQSKIAVGSGGLWGQGLFQGSQTQLKMVPEQRTDFIFSVVAEELGFLGATFVILCYLIIIFRILWVAYHSEAPQELYTCVGVATLFLLHILINIGMNIDLLPVKGVTLPFFSYGGTAMVIHLSAMALVESIDLSRKSDHWVSRIG